MTTRSMADVADHRVVLEADFADEDETAHICGRPDDPDNRVPG